VMALRAHIIYMLAGPDPAYGALRERVVCIDKVPPLDLPAF
jgi:hypothetical protein